ncbi:hypothetical protein LCGC14_2509490 [marine sediment metagenome]|uniref:Uncharacterized protein n=1 Tax=marine sediment metagenome TaxID=412755 RepID=A0A0F9DBC2_9ZZZZ
MAELAIRPWEPEPLIDEFLDCMRELCPPEHRKIRIRSTMPKPIYQAWFTRNKTPPSGILRKDHFERLSKVLTRCKPGVPIHLEGGNGNVWRTVGKFTPEPLQRWWGIRHADVAGTIPVAHSFLQRALLDSSFEGLLREFTEDQADQLSVAMDKVRSEGRFRTLKALAETSDIVSEKDTQTNDQT